MNSTQIFLPVLIQVLIPIAGFMLLGIRKSQALKSGNVDMTKTALDNDAWPDDVLKVSNNIRNQFQVPVLFYVLCFVFYAINGVSSIVLYLAWGFVISRIVHAFIHMTSNYVPARFSVFTVGFVIMVLMTILAIKALVAA